VTDSKTGSGEMWSYEHDHRGRLTDVSRQPYGKASVGGPYAIRYAYDTFDRLIERRATAIDSEETTPDNIQRYVLTGNQPYADASADGTIAVRYLFGPDGQPLARMESQTMFYLTDRQNSVLQIVDANGDGLKRIQYAGLTESKAEGSVVDRFSVGGQRRDGNTGLTQMGERWYQPDVGRYLTEGGRGMGLNPYPVAGNSAPNAALGTDYSAPQVFGDDEFFGVKWATAYNMVSDSANSAMTDSAWWGRRANNVWNGFAEVPRIFWDVGQVIGAAGRNALGRDPVAPDFHSMLVNGHLDSHPGGTESWFDWNGFVRATPWGWGETAVEVGTELGNGNTDPLEQLFGGYLFSRMVGAGRSKPGAAGQAAPVANPVPTPRLTAAASAPIARTMTRTGPLRMIVAQQLQVVAETVASGMAVVGRSAGRVWNSLGGVPGAAVPGAMSAALGGGGSSGRGQSGGPPMTGDLLARDPQYQAMRARLRRQEIGLEAPEITGFALANDANYQGLVRQVRLRALRAQHGDRFQVRMAEETQAALARRLTSGARPRTSTYANSEAPSALLKSIRRKFQMEGIADNPRMNSLWNGAVDSFLVSRRDNVVRRYNDGRLRASETVEDVFDAVKARFKDHADTAGVALPEGPIHHWNWNKADFPNQVITPENLFFVPDRLHNANNLGLGPNGVHQTLQSPGFHPTVDPIPPAYIRPVSNVRRTL